MLEKIYHLSQYLDLFIASVHYVELSKGKVRATFEVFKYKIDKLVHFIRWLWFPHGKDKKRNIYSPGPLKLPLFPNVAALLDDDQFVHNAWQTTEWCLFYLWPNCSVSCGAENKMFWGDKTGISQLFVKHCEQTDHHPTMQRHLEKVEAIEVLDCTSKWTVHISQNFQYWL